MEGDIHCGVAVARIWELQAMRRISTVCKGIWRSAVGCVRFRRVLMGCDGLL